MTTQHTPTPWAHDKDLVHNYDAMYVAKTADLKDAAHIVRCVNAHDELVAALCEIAGHENKTLLYGHHKSEDVQLAYQEGAATAFGQLAEIARAALAKLEQS